MSLFGLFALILFLLGKYSVGLTRLEGRLLRQAQATSAGAYVSFAVTACIAAVEVGSRGWIISRRKCSPECWVVARKH